MELIDTPNPNAKKIISDLSESAFQGDLNKANVMTFSILQDKSVNAINEKKRQVSADLFNDGAVVEEIAKEVAEDLSLCLSKNFIGLG